jgi:recombination protein RecR
VPTYAAPIQELIDSLGRLPGVGPKSAQRIAFYLLDADREEAMRLTRAIIEVKDKVRFCERCFNVSEAELCGVCDDDRRDAHVLCVVEEPKDVVAVERTGTYSGRYHVLGGAIDHLRGIGPDRLHIRELVARIGEEDITEVILCTNPNLEGEATALYLSRLLDLPGLEVSRIASGLPVGGDLEYADELTLGRALEGRTHVGGSPAVPPAPEPTATEAPPSVGGTA